MRDDLTEIGIIVDRSGSMKPLTESTIKGFNGFVEEQKTVPGSANVSLTFFNHVVDLELRSVPLEIVPLLTNETYKASGNTALYDAVGMTIEDIGKRLADMTPKDRASKVIIFIITDGEENHSHLYTHQQVADMIKHQQDVYSWQFHFMGANIDVPQVAVSMNIPVAQAAAFVPTNAGNTLNYLAASESTTRYRTSK